MAQAVESFSREHVESRRGYGQIYGGKPKSPEQQLATLRIFFPHVTPFNRRWRGTSLPNGAEGFFVIPHWPTIGKSVQDALTRVLEAIEMQRGREHTRFNLEKMTGDYFRRNEGIGYKLNLLHEAQACDTLLIAAQFGLRYAGRSARRVRYMVDDSSPGGGNGKEFCLDAYMTAIMLLTHPERLESSHNLWLICPGSDYSVSGRNQYDGVPSFELCRVAGEQENVLCFDSCTFRASDEASGLYGAATGFLL